MEQTQDNRWSVGCDAADEPTCMGYQNFTTFARRGEARDAWNTRAVIPAPAQAVGVREALEQAKAALFKIRACSIVGCEQGYGQPEKWADALFASHADVAAALKAIDAALASQPSPAATVEERQVSCAPGGQPYAKAPQRSSAGTADVRQKAENAIRTFCQSLGTGSVSISSDGVERIYYAGINLKALSVAVALAIRDLPQTPLMRAAENAAKTVEGWSKSKREYAERIAGRMTHPKQS